MHKMKIVQLLPSLDDGGAETLVKDYALKLKERGEDVYVIIVHNYSKSSNYNILKTSGIAIIPLFHHYNIFTRSIVKLFAKYLIPFKLKKIFSRIHPEVIHIHLELLQPISAIANTLNAKLLFTCHSDPSTKFGPDYPNELEAARFLCHHYGLQVIALHDDMKIKLNKMLEIDNVKVLYNCIPIQRFSKNERNRDVIRKSLGISQSTIVLGHVGRFSEAKNHTFLIKIAYEAMKIKDDIKLLLVGDGSLLPFIKEKIEQLGILHKTIFLSHRSDVPDLLKAMDVFVFPSLFEGFPVTLIETQAVGLPCLASDVITKEAFVSKNIYSMSLNDSPKKWAEKVLSIVGEFYYDQRIEKFDIDNIIEELIRLYKQ